MSVLIVISFFIQLYLNAQWSEIVSDEFEKTGTYLVLDKPKNVIEHIGRVVFMDAFGSCVVVTDDMTYYFLKDHRTLSKRNHVFNPRKKYIRTSYKVPKNDKKFNYITNNCKHLYYATNNTTTI